MSWRDRWERFLIRLQLRYHGTAERYWLYVARERDGLGLDAAAVDARCRAAAHGLAKLVASMTLTGRGFVALAGEARRTAEAFREAMEVFGRREIGGAP